MFFVNKAAQKMGSFFVFNYYNALSCYSKIGRIPESFVSFMLRLVSDCSVL